MNQSEKLHFKMYKSGRRWLVAAVAGVGVAVGIGTAKALPVAADTTVAAQPISVPTTQKGSDQSTETLTTPDSAAPKSQPAASQKVTVTVAPAASTRPGSQPTTAESSGPVSTRVAVSPVASSAATVSSSAPTVTPSPAQPVVNGMGDVSTSIGSGQNKATVVSYGTSNAAPDVTGASTDIDARNADALSASFTVGNSTASTLHIHPVIMLPLINDNHTGWVLDPSKITEATFTDVLPSTLTLTYSMDGFDGQYLTYTALMQQHPDFTWDKLQAIMIDGPIAAGSKYTVDLPMIWRSTGSTIGEMGAENFNSANYASYDDITASARLVPLTYGTATTTRTINFVVPSGKPMAAPVVQTITYKTVQNGATYQTAYTPQGVYEQYQVPPISGYTADVASVPLLAVDATTTEPTNAKDVTVTYTPNLKYGTATTTRTINFVDENGKQIADPKVQTVTYKTVTNEATGKTDYTPQGGYEPYQVPPISGYTADVATVPSLAVDQTTTAPTNAEDVTVTYTPKLGYGTASSTRTINFVDENGKRIADPKVQTITYKTVTNEATGETDYTPQDVYEKYQVPPISGYTADVTTVARVAVDPSTTAPTNAEDVTVTYTPILTYGTASSTRTINLVDVNGKVLRDPIKQTVTYKTVTNVATGQTIYTPQGTYAQFAVPTEHGYTADQTTVAQQAIGTSTTAPQNTSVTVTYTPILTYGTASSTRTINLVDVNGKDLHAPIQQTVTYKTVTNEATGQTVYTPQGAYDQFTVPSEHGYTANQTTIAQQVIGTSTTAPIDISVTVTYTPNLTYGTATSTRTIYFVDANGNQLHAPVVQTITYKTLTNQATGVTTYTAQGAYDEVVAPVVAGYTAQQQTVAQQAVGASDTVPASTEITVRYIKNAPTGNGGGTSTGTPGGTTTGTGEGRPTLPDTDASDDGTATGPETGTEASGKTQTSGLKSGNIAAATNSAAKSKRPKLPDTGNGTSGAIALAGAALMTLLGLGELRRTRQ